MRILITGGAGFIGSAVVRRAVSKGHEVINFDKLTYAANLAGIASVADEPRYTFIRGDICDAMAVATALAETAPDAIMHLAAESHVDRSIDGPADFISTNIVGTYTLLDAALAYYRELPSPQRDRFRFHHISTDEVFGMLGPTGRFDERTPYAPRSPYSASKAASDHLVRAWHETYGLPVVVTNCSNNYGPFQYPEKLIPVVILNALAGEPIPVYGTGANIRDWLYVEDHAAALMAVLERGTVGETFNIGGDAEVRNIDLVRMVCSVLDTVRPQSAPHERLISFVTDRPGHDFRYSIDASKIRNALGWKPAVSLAEGLELTVRWFVENESLWRQTRSGEPVGQRIGLGRAAREERTAP